MRGDGVRTRERTLPLLFNVYVEEALLTNPVLKDEYKYGGMLAYADDLVCTFASQPEVERIIRVMETLENRWGLRMNRKKS